MSRFSKDALRRHIIERIERRAHMHGFTTDNGWNQVKDAPIEKIVAYGEYSALRDLLDDIDGGFVK